MMYGVSTVRGAARLRAAGRFTLVELLVVIAIIAVLASMLLPSLQRARDMAKRASCTSQYKQMGIVMTMYAEENEGWLLEKTQTRNEVLSESIISADGESVGTMVWQPYVGDSRIYFCPDPPQGGYFNNREANGAAVDKAWTNPVTRLRSTFVTPRVYATATLDGVNSVGYNDWARALRRPSQYYISGKLDDNLHDINGRIRPILVDSQFWSTNPVYHTNTLYGGCHGGQYTPILYPDGAALPLQTNMRGRFFWGYRYIGDAAITAADKAAGIDWNALMDVRQ